VNRVVLNELAAAREAFAEALRNDPSIDVDPEVFKPAVVRLFREVKAKTETETKTVEPEKARSGQLTVRSQPPGAEVLLDGTPLGRTPLEKTTVPAGEHKILVRLEGHHEQLRPVVVQPETEARVELELSARVSLLRPGTRRFSVSIGIGGALAAHGSVHATVLGNDGNAYLFDFGFSHGFSAIEEVGFHFSRSSSGPALGLVLVETVGALKEPTGTYEKAGLSFGYFGIQPGLRFWWDIPLGQRALYLSPSLQVTYAYWHVSGNESVVGGVDTSASIHALSVQPALDLKLVIADRVLFYFRPVALEVVSVLDVDKSGFNVPVTNDSVVLRYGLQVGGGVTF